MRYTILVADDDKEIARAIQVYLESVNYNVLLAYNGEEAIRIFRENDVDLLIMDIMMPIMDGSKAVEEIRKVSVVPVIMLSAKSEESDKIAGLNIGADDYITKPFNPMELIARVNSNIRRYTRYGSLKAESGANSIRIGGVFLNKMTGQVSVDGEDIKITPLEYKILSLLMSNPNRVFSIDEIYENVWKEPAINPETVTVHIRRIREKIEVNPKNPEYIKVVWGIGYKFCLKIDDNKTFSKT